MGHPVKCNGSNATGGCRRRERSSDGVQWLGAACSALLLGNAAVHIRASTGRSSLWSAPSSQILALILLT